jgi:NADP-dependent 3-hydroxy acid dehydrogenase YdfG
VPVSILVNNAGVSSPATLESYDSAAMARMRRVNVDGVIHTVVPRRRGCRSAAAWRTGSHGQIPSGPGGSAREARRLIRGRRRRLLPAVGVWSLVEK